jgi:HK97 family phage major capsid protein
MMNPQALKQERAKKLSEARALTTTGDMDETKQTRFDELDREIAGIDANLTRAQKMQDWERQASAQVISGNGKDSYEQESRKASLINFIKLGIPDMAGNEDLGREKEIHQELNRRSGGQAKGILVPTAVFEKRVMTTALPSGGEGSNLIATDHLGNQYIDLLKSKLITSRMGATVLSGLVGNVDIPKGKTGATSGWVAENAGLSAADLGFEKISMTPKHAGCLTEFSRNMLQQTSPDIEMLVRKDFAAELALAIDRVAIAGGGSNEPSGILEHSTNTSSMTTPTWAGLLAMIEAVELDNADGGRLGWATNPSLVRKLRSTLKVTGDAGAGFLMDDSATLAGYALASSNLVPSAHTNSPAELTSTLIYGDWSSLMLGYWSSFEILVNPYEATAYSKGNVQVRGMITADVDLRHDESFCVAETVTSAA